MLNVLCHDAEKKPCMLDLDKVSAIQRIVSEEKSDALVVVELQIEGKVWEIAGGDSQKLWDHIQKQNMGKPHFTVLSPQ